MFKDNPHLSPWLAPAETSDTTPPAFEFEVGDVVALVSGGPGMTVVDVCECGSVTVAWFAEDELCEACFPEEALMYVD